MKRASMARGLAAGAAGTALMTAWQALSARLEASGAEDDERRDDAAPDPWEHAPVPAKVARRIGEGLLGVDVPSERIPLLTQVMHWGYGTAWGTAYGLLTGDARRSPAASGALFGAFVWVMSYVQLVPMGLYEPPWRYPPKEVAMDLSHHLVYGVGEAQAYDLLLATR
jgi:hypothetical protein